MRALLLLALVACRTEDPVPVEEYAIDACGASAVVAARPRPPGEYGYARWKPPPTPAERLFGLPIEVVGADPGLEASYEIDVAATSWTALDPGWTLLLRPEPTADPSRLRLLLRPGEVQRIEVVVSTNPSPTDWDQKHRATSFTLDRTAAGDQPIELIVDLDRVLQENWGDETQSGATLASIALTLPETPREGFSLDRVLVDGSAWRYPEAAGWVEAETWGRLRPALYVRSGARAVVRTWLPWDAQELTWYEGLALASATRTVRVIAGDDATDVSVQRGRAYDWSPQRIDIRPWAGRDVAIEFSAAGNGVALFGTPRITRKPASKWTPNVILYMIDTLRADHVGAWGNQRARTPAFDRLASEGVQFAFAISTSAWTKPAIPSLFTGVHPTTHRVGTGTYADGLPDTVATLQDRFGAAGWRTASVSASPLGSTLSRLERGFDLAVPPSFWRGRIGNMGHPDAAQVQYQFTRFVDEDPGAPFFAYLHTLEPHAWRRPRFTHPPKGRTRYEAAVTEQDRRLEGLLAWLGENGLAERTLIVVVSDHGESFGDHGITGHGVGLYQSQIHVPLVFWAGSTLPPMTVTDPVSLVDIAPTLLDLAGIEALHGVAGRSLRPYIDGDDRPLHDAVFAERIRYVWEPDDPAIHAVVTRDRSKLVRQGDRVLPFDLSADLCEPRTTGRVSRALVRRLDGFLAFEEASARRFAEDHPPETATATDAEIEALRTLGYLE